MFPAPQPLPPVAAAASGPTAALPPFVSLLVPPASIFWYNAQFAPSAERGQPVRQLMVPGFENKALPRRNAIRYHWTARMRYEDTTRHENDDSKNTRTKTKPPANINKNNNGTGTTTKTQQQQTHISPMHRKLTPRARA